MFFADVRIVNNPPTSPIRTVRIETTPLPLGADVLYVLD